MRGERGKHEGGIYRARGWPSACSHGEQKKGKFGSPARKSGALMAFYLEKEV